MVVISSFNCVKVVRVVAGKINKSFSCILAVNLRINNKEISRKKMVNIVKVTNQILYNILFMHIRFITNFYMELNS